MENGSPSTPADIQGLQNRVIALEQQLAQAQAAIQMRTTTPDNGALSRSELLFAHSRDMILFMRRADGAILDANTAALHGYGYTYAQLLTLTIQDLLGQPARAAD